MSEDILAAVKKANIRFGERVRNSDAAGLAALYTEDTGLMPPNSEKLYMAGRLRRSSGEEL